MVQTGVSELRVVSEALKSQGDFDEHARSCFAALEERLERVKGLGGAYGAIDFSPGLKRRQGRKPLVTVS